MGIEPRTLKADSDPWQTTGPGVEFSERERDYQFSQLPPPLVTSPIGGNGGGIIPCSVAMATRSQPSVLGAGAATASICLLIAYHYVLDLVVGFVSGV